MKPGTTEYVNAHQAVYKARGGPSLCEECGTESGRFEWANRTGAYDDPWDYVRMCIPCHRSRDKRAGHDRRMDHTWTPDAAGRRCSVCRARSKAAEYGRIKANPERYAHLRALNLEAQRRYSGRRRANA